jgi:uncharacterized protein (TIGR02996 family)
VSDLESFLASLEAEPADDALWLVFADWLEERGDPLASAVREAVEVNSWYRLREDLLQQLDRRTLRLVGSELVEKILPLFERRYPDDRSPRVLLESARHPKFKGITAATKPVLAAYRRANEDAINEPETYLTACLTILAVYHLNGWPQSVAGRVSETIITDRFGRAAYGKPIASSKPEWLAARDAEIRRQVAQILRHRFDQEGEPS